MRLLISVQLDTTEEYDELVARSKMSKEEGQRSPAMVLQEKVAQQLGGLRFVQRGNITVQISKVVPTATPTREDTTPVEKRRTG